MLVEGRLGALGGGLLFVIFFIRIKRFSTLISLNPRFFIALHFRQLLLEMLLHLALVHILDFLNNEIWNRGRTSIRVVVIIDIYIIVVYYLNDFGGIALSHVAQA